MILDQVFTEQGSSASQMTACAGQAPDAASACTLVKMENAPTLLKIPKSENPDIWIRLRNTKWPKSWSSIEDPVVPLERNLCGHPLARVGKTIWVCSMEIRLGMCSKWGLFIRFPRKRVILICVCG